MLFYSTLIALWLDGGDEHLRHANHALVDGCRQHSGLPQDRPVEREVQRGSVDDNEVARRWHRQPNYSGRRVKDSRGGRAQRSGALNALPTFWGMQGLP